jgi:cytochrome b561
MAPLRNTESGYGSVTKWLHWSTVVALAAQFVVGYLLDDESGRGRGRGRGGDGDDGDGDDGDSSGPGSGHELVLDSGRGRGRGGDDDWSIGFGPGDDRLATVHVALGLTILALTVLRLCWRRATALPTWAEELSPGERLLATWTERLLYLCLLGIPVTGLSLLLVSDDLLWLHVASHIVFFVALALHLGLVLKHSLVDRDGLFSRMT